MGKNDESAPVRAQALELANAIQVHGYARQLQTQGHQDQALELFRTNVKKHPNS